MKLAKLSLLLFTPQVGKKPQYIIISLLDPDLFFFYERSVRVYSFPTDRMTYGVVGTCMVDSCGSAVLSSPVRCFDG